MKYAIGVDIGATNIRVVLGNDKGRIIAKLKGKTRKKGTRNAITEQIIEMIKSLMKNHHGKKIQGIGIGSIGPIDTNKKAILHSPNIPFDYVPFAKLKQLRKPVYFLNDCPAAVLGEKYFGAGKKHRNIVYITISTGIGAGAMVDGNLLVGREGNAAEVGHFFVDEKYSLLCDCKKGRGHWEGTCSGKNHARFFRAWLKKSNIKHKGFRNSKDIFAAARKGDKTVQRFIDELGKLNARAVSDIIVAYNPSIITLGGAVALNERKLILDPIKKHIDHYLKPPKILMTPLGKDAVLLGALAMVFKKQGVRL